MELWREPEAFVNACDDARAEQQTVALVPTMGALHDGHLALVEAARRHGTFVVVSIFVNPTQFGPGEDLDKYPRTLNADAERCRAAGVAGVFAPEREAMYPPGDETRVRVGRTAAALCGAHRPGHFEGVATIVTKLWALTGRCTSLFGRKDFQQLAVLRRVAADLFLPVTVVGVPTVREPDGLAMSSRNAYLSAAARQRALAIPRGLAAAVVAFEGGERRVGALRSLAAGPIEAAADRVDYVEIADADSIEPLASDASVEGRTVLATAARFDGARLIDNVVFGEDAAPIAN